MNKPITELADLSSNLFDDIKKIRQTSPLVHNITNYVVMNFTANALLAIGASPVMAHAIDEVSEMTSISKALVINIGTLSKLWIQAMLSAGMKAKQKKIPVILDPVGSGATKYRTETAFMLIKEISPSVIRGNASEIKSLSGTGNQTKGVDSLINSEEIIEIAIQISKAFNCVVSVSGKTDVIVENNKVVKIDNGHPIMSKVTGMGCTASAMMGAFAAVNPSYFNAAINTMALMGIAGEVSASCSKGPGSFQSQFLDTLYQINDSEILPKLKIQKL